MTRLRGLGAGQARIPGEYGPWPRRVQGAEQALRLDSLRVQETAAWVSPPADRDFARGRGWGLVPTRADVGTRSAGVIFLLTTADDRPADRVNTDQALQQILFTSAAYGVAAALHSQPPELGWLRDFIRAWLGGGSHPQLLRPRTVTQTAASVRRPPASVLYRHDN